VGRLERAERVEVGGVGERLLRIQDRGFERLGREQGGLLRIVRVVAVRHELPH
jgi:hypothetical protein